MSAWTRPQRVSRAVREDADLASHEEWLREISELPVPDFCEVPDPGPGRYRPPTPGNGHLHNGGWNPQTAAAPPARTQGHPAAHPVARPQGRRDARTQGAPSAIEQAARAAVTASGSQPVLPATTTPPCPSAGLGRRLLIAATASAISYYEAAGECPDCHAEPCEWHWAMKLRAAEFGVLLSRLHAAPDDHTAMAAVAESGIDDAALDGWGSPLAITAADGEAS